MIEKIANRLDSARPHPGAPLPARGERATRHGGKPEFGLVRGRFHESERAERGPFRRLRLAERPPHPTLSPQAGRGSETPCPNNVANSHTPVHGFAGAAVHAL